MPVLAQAEEALKGKPVKFVSITTNDGDTAESVKKWHKKHGANDGVWVGKINRDGANKLHAAYKMEFKFIPSTFVVGKNGEILGHFGGIHDKNQLLSLIEPALK